MKKTDIALLIIIVSLSGLLSYWVASATIGKANDKPIIVRTVDAITVDDITVDKTVFSKDAINPTVETSISGEDLTSFMEGGEDATDDSGERAPSGNSATPNGTEGESSESLLSPSNGE